MTLSPEQEALFRARFSQIQAMIKDRTRPQRVGLALDFMNKGAECLEKLGWDNEAQIRYFEQTNPITCETFDVTYDEIEALLQKAAALSEEFGEHLEFQISPEGNLTYRPFGVSP